MNNFFMSFLVGQALVSRVDGVTAADKTTAGALLAMFGLKPVGVVLVSRLVEQRVRARDPVVVPTPTPVPTPSPQPAPSPVSTGTTVVVNNPPPSDGAPKSRGGG